MEQGRRGPHHEVATIKPAGAPGSVTIPPLPPPLPETEWSGDRIHGTSHGVAGNLQRWIDLYIMLARAN
jgi:hypothetical protein